MADPQDEVNKWRKDNEKRTREVENAKKQEQKEAKRQKDQAKFRTQIYSNNKEVDTLKTRIIRFNKELTPLQETYSQANRDARDPGSENGVNISPTEQNVIDQANYFLRLKEKSIKDATNRIDELEKDNVVLRKKLNDTIKPDPWEKEQAKNPISRKTSKKPALNPEPNGKVDIPKGYKYNLPLLKNAWHHPLGAQAISLGRTVETIEGTVAATGQGAAILNPGNYKDAIKAWAGVRPGRGTFQVNKRLFQAMVTNQGAFNSNLDYQMYGFKFLYNPKEVNMSYSTWGKLNPEYQATGRDEFTAIVPTGSFISFNLLLNRIEDMDYVTASGLYVDRRDVYGPGKTGVDEEAIEIYNKGTMYDLEYFFKMINSPRGTFTSEFNIETADYGYLPPKIVDLHLGASMRYRVIPQSLAITHLIFNPRMVPTLTSVKIDCVRLPQVVLPELQKNIKQNRSVGVTGYSGGGGRESLIL